MTVSKTDSGRPAIPAPTPETKEWFGVDDFRAALRAANFDAATDEQQVAYVAKISNKAVSYVLSAKRLPHKRKLEASVKTVTSIEANCRSVVKKLLSELPPLERENRSEIALCQALTSSNSVALLGLLSACADPSDTLAGPRTLAGLLINIEKLADCAAAAARQLQVGVDNTQEFAHQGQRKIPEQFGHCLIESYVALTRSEPKYSRRSTTTPNENEVSGRLIRYLQTLFERLPAAIADHPWTADLASEPSWSPKPETIASWIDSYRKIPRQGQTE